MKANPFGPYFSAVELDAVNASGEHLDKLLLLVKYVLNPVREKFGPLIITSGYRDKAHNSSVGGVMDSQHCLGEAVDFICHKAPSLEIFNWMRDNLVVGELFYYKRKGHIHVSLPNFDMVKHETCDIKILDK